MSKDASPSHGKSVVEPVTGTKYVTILPNGWHFVGTAARFRRAGLFNEKLFSVGFYVDAITCTARMSAVSKSLLDTPIDKLESDPALYRTLISSSFSCCFLITFAAPVTPGFISSFFEKELISREVHPDTVHTFVSGLAFDYDIHQRLLLTTDGHSITKIETDAATDVCPTITSPELSSALRALFFDKHSIVSRDPPSLFASSLHAQGPMQLGTGREGLVRMLPELFQSVKARARALRERQRHRDEEGLGSSSGSNVGSLGHSTSSDNMTDIANGSSSGSNATGRSVSNIGVRTVSRRSRIGSGTGNSDKNGRTGAAVTTPASAHADAHSDASARTSTGTDMAINVAEPSAADLLPHRFPPHEEQYVRYVLYGDNNDVSSPIPAHSLFSSYTSSQGSGDGSSIGTGVNTGMGYGDGNRARHPAHLSRAAALAHANATADTRANTHTYNHTDTGVHAYTYTQVPPPAPPQSYSQPVLSSPAALDTHALPSSTSLLPSCSSMPPGPVTSSPSYHTMVAMLPSPSQPVIRGDQTLLRGDYSTLHSEHVILGGDKQSLENGRINDPHGNNITGTGAGVGTGTGSLSSLSLRTRSTFSHDDAAPLSSSPAIAALTSGPSFLSSQLSPSMSAMSSGGALSNMSNLSLSSGPLSSYPHHHHTSQTGKNIGKLNGKNPTKTNTVLLHDPPPPHLAHTHVHHSDGASPESSFYRENSNFSGHSPRPNLALTAKSGYLCKYAYGIFGDKWRHRFCQLSGCLLVYRKTPDTPLRGCLDLTWCTIYVHPERRKLGNWEKPLPGSPEHVSAAREHVVFTITSQKTSEQYVLSADVDTARVWLRALAITVCTARDEARQLMARHRLQRLLSTGGRSPNGNDPNSTATAAIPNGAGSSSDGGADVGRGVPGAIAGAPVHAYLHDRRGSDAEESVSVSNTHNTTHTTSPSKRVRRRFDPDHAFSPVRESHDSGKTTSLSEIPDSASERQEAVLAHVHDLQTVSGIGGVNMRALQRNKDVQTSLLSLDHEYSRRVSETASAAQQEAQDVLPVFVRAILDPHVSTHVPPYTPRRAHSMRTEPPHMPSRVVSQLHTPDKGSSSSSSARSISASPSTVVTTGNSHTVRTNATHTPSSASKPTPVPRLAQRCWLLQWVDMLALSTHLRASLSCCFRTDADDMSAISTSDSTAPAASAASASCPSSSRARAGVRVGVRWDTLLAALFVVLQCLLLWHVLLSRDSAAIGSQDITMTNADSTTGDGIAAMNCDRVAIGDSWDMRVLHNGNKTAIAQGTSDEIGTCTADAPVPIFDAVSDHLTRIGIGGVSLRDVRTQVWNMYTHMRVPQSIYAWLQHHISALHDRLTVNLYNMGLLYDDGLSASVTANLTKEEYMARAVEVYARRRALDCDVINTGIHISTNTLDSPASAPAPLSKPTSNTHTDTDTTSTVVSVSRCLPVALNSVSLASIAATADPDTDPSTANPSAVQHHHFSGVTEIVR